VESGFVLKDHPDGSVTFNLNWTPPPSLKQPPDLDIGCLYILSNGHRGAVQAAGGHLGTSESMPHICIPRDDRDGAGDEGETLIIARPQFVAFAVVFAMIYRGVSDFRAVGAVLQIEHPGLAPRAIALASPDPGLRWCALAVCGCEEGKFVVLPQERYFLSARHADDHYGIGLDWGIGLKDWSSHRSPKAADSGPGI